MKDLLPPHFSMFNVQLSILNCGNRLDSQSTQDRYNVRLTHNQVFGTFELQFCAGILAIKNYIALLKEHLLVLCTLANSNNLTTKVVNLALRE